MRQVYVALTRARERTYVVWGPLGRKSKNAARSGLSLIAGPAFASCPDRTSMAQALAAADALWPEMPSAETIAAAEFLKTRLKGAQKKDFEANGCTTWDTVRKQLVHFGWAKLAGKTYLPTEKSVHDLPASPDIDSFRKAIGSPAGGQVDAPPAEVARAPYTDGSAGWSAAGVPRGIPRAWSITSFSGLTRGADAQHLAGALADEQTTAPVRSAATGIHDFPAGPGPGVGLHQIIEHADLATPDSAGNRTLVREQLRGLRCSEAHQAAVIGMLADLGASRVPGTTTPLASLDGGRIRHEWPFDLGVHAADGTRGLAEACRQHGDALYDAAWADRLARLPAHDLQGFLNGRADLIACIDGQWWVIDWKSNRLGTQADAYTPAAMRADAAKHHYPLQWMIYLVALHRHLSACLGGAYRPKDHLGGAAYCYLRGLRRDDPEAGWLVHRPAVALLKACDDALGRHALETAP